MPAMVGRGDLGPGDTHTSKAHMCLRGPRLHPGMKRAPPAFIPSSQHCFSPSFRLHCLGFRIRGWGDGWKEEVAGASCPPPSTHCIAHVQGVTLTIQGGS